MAALTGTRVDLRLLESVTAAPAVDARRAASPRSAVGRRRGAAVPARDRPARGGAGGRGAPRAAPSTAWILAALGALGCDDDARLAFHAEAAGDGAAVLRSRAGRRPAGGPAGRAPRGGRAVRAGAALRRRADRPTLADAVRAARRRGGAAGPVAGGGRRRASGRWRCGGRSATGRREGDTLRRLSRIRWRHVPGRRGARRRRGRGVHTGAARPERRARLGVRDLGQPADAVRATTTARSSWPGGPRELAETLGATDVLSDALNTEACAPAGRDGDVGGRAAPRRWTSRLTGGLQEQAGRAFANLCGIHSDKRRFAEAERVPGRGRRLLRRARHQPRTAPACAASRPTCWSASAGGTRPSR